MYHFLWSTKNIKMKSYPAFKWVLLFFRRRAESEKRHSPKCCIISLSFIIFCMTVYGEVLILFHCLYLYASILFRLWALEWQVQYFTVLIDTFSHTTLLTIYKSIILWELYLINEIISSKIEKFCMKNSKLGFSSVDHDISIWWRSKYILTISTKYLCLWFCFDTYN